MKKVTASGRLVIKPRIQPVAMAEMPMSCTTSRVALPKNFPAMVMASNEPQIMTRRMLRELAMRRGVSYAEMLAKAEAEGVELPEE